MDSSQLPRKNFGFFRSGSRTYALDKIFPTAVSMVILGKFFRLFCFPNAMSVFITSICLDYTRPTRISIWCLFATTAAGHAWGIWQISTGMWRKICFTVGQPIHTIIQRPWQHFACSRQQPARNQIILPGTLATRRQGFHKGRWQESDIHLRLYVRPFHNVQQAPLGCWLPGFFCLSYLELLLVELISSHKSWKAILLHVFFAKCQGKGQTRHMFLHNGPSPIWIDEFQVFLGIGHLSRGQRINHMLSSWATVGKF